MAAGPPVHDSGYTSLENREQILLILLLALSRRLESAIYYNLTLGVMLFDMLRLCGQDSIVVSPGIFH